MNALHRRLVASITAAVLLASTVALIMSATAAFAQETAPNESTETFEPAIADSAFIAQNSASRVRWFPPRLYAAGFFYLPKLSYSTDRGLGVGLRMLRYFRLPWLPLTCPASILSANMRWTLKGQKLADIESTLFMSNELFLRSRISYSDLSYRFYGIGPSTPKSDEEVYRPQSLRAYTELLHNVVSNLWLGARFEAENVSLMEVDPEGALAQGDVRGTDASTVAGWGAVLEWDHRYPQNRLDWNLQGFALWFDEELGSSHDFNNYNFDLRTYLKMGSEYELAGQVFLYSTRGEPPFWRYAAMGGRVHTRGYRRGRYLDRTLIAFQQELRFPIAWRVRGVAFAGLGDIASRLTNMELDDMKATVGGGLRFIMGEGEKARVRFDVALGGETPRFYLAFGEAF